MYSTVQDRPFTPEFQHLPEVCQNSCSPEPQGDFFPSISKAWLLVTSCLWPRSLPALMHVATSLSAEPLTSLCMPTLGWSPARCKCFSPPATCFYLTQNRADGIRPTPILLNNITLVHQNIWCAYSKLSPNETFTLSVTTCEHTETLTWARTSLSVRILDCSWDWLWL